MKRLYIYAGHTCVSIGTNILSHRVFVHSNSNIWRVSLAYTKICTTSYICRFFVSVVILNSLCLKRDEVVSQPTKDWMRTISYNHSISQENLNVYICYFSPGFKNCSPEELDKAVITTITYYFNKITFSWQSCCSFKLSVCANFLLARTISNLIFLVIE